MLLTLHNFVAAEVTDRGVWGLDPLKICGRGQSMFRPLKMSHSFIQNGCWITQQVSQHQRWKTCVENGR